jgi:hypothetical protein
LTVTVEPGAVEVVPTMTPACRVAEGAGAAAWEAEASRARLAPRRHRSLVNMLAVFSTDEETTGS